MIFISRNYEVVSWEFSTASPKRWYRLLWKNIQTRELKKLGVWHFTAIKTISTPSYGVPHVMAQLVDWIQYFPQLPTGS